jgi:hypothetical protein
VAELTAAWLSGDLASQPGYYGSCDVDEHLAPGMTDALVALCRAGAVTTGSQAGLVAGDVAQRAWVDAFVPDALLTRLKAKAEDSSYQVIAHGPGSALVAVTWWQWQACTSTGWVEPRHWAWLYRGVGKGAVAELLTAHQVSIIDPAPGRNKLWAWLLDVLVDAGVEDRQDRCPVCDADRCPLCGAHGGYCGAGCPESCSWVPPSPPRCDRCGTQLPDAPDDPAGSDDLREVCGHCGHGDSTTDGDGWLYWPITLEEYPCPTSTEVPASTRAAVRALLDRRPQLLVEPERVYDELRSRGLGVPLVVAHAAVRDVADPGWRDADGRGPDAPERVR